MLSKDEEDAFAALVEPLRRERDLQSTPSWDRQLLLTAVVCVTAGIVGLIGGVGWRLPAVGVAGFVFLLGGTVAAVSAVQRRRRRRFPAPPDMVTSASSWLAERWQSRGHR